MRRARKSTYVFDAGMLRDKMRQQQVSADELQGLMRVRGHRCEVAKYMSGKTVPTSEVLIDLLDILNVDVSAVVKAVFSRRQSDG